MSMNTLAGAPEGLAPIQGGERIQALDVVRGFALIGIFLMNIEFFNRPLQALGQGLPTDVTGLDHWAGWFIYSFVQGKFWTMFSLLFGMGFAVMLTRAERAQRNFLKPYLRRIAALAVFGTLHHIFIWGGDILFSYAVAAAGLLIVLYGRAKPIAVALVAVLTYGVLGGLELLPRYDAPMQAGVGLLFMAIAAMYLRGERKVRIGGRDWLVFSLPFLVFGALVALAAIVFWLVPSLPHQARVPLSIFGPVLLLIGWASDHFHDPVEPRTRRLGVGMYLFPFTMMTLFGIAQILSPNPPPAGGEAALAAAQAKAAAVAATAASAGSPGKAADKAPPAKAEGDKGPKGKAAKAEPKPTEAQAWADEKMKRAERRSDYRKDLAEEQRIETSGTYMEAVKLRAGEFFENAGNEANFAIILVGMFLLGAWFVRSGIMENTAAHLPLFRKLALVCLPLGVGMGLFASTFIASANTPGLDNDPYQIAMGLTLIGNLPACLGYVSVIVLLLHSATVFANIKVLAPLGRMALTNYLTHSLLGTFYFYGYGLGHWGMGRAMQVVFVAVVITLQVIFCHWWLARFRYGPMEWLWRAITYWTVPPMRR